MQLLSFLRSYMMVRSLDRHYDRGAFLFAQSLMLQTALEHARNKIPVFRELDGVDPRHLSSFPHCDKGRLNADFKAYNIHGVTLSQAAEANSSTGFIKVRGKKVFCGSSTGTSGNKGYYLIDGHERFAWLGATLAKLLPGFWKSRKKIAVILPRNTPLYTGANRTFFLNLRFFDTSLGPDVLARSIEVFAPDIMIAAPRLARVIGELAPGLTPERVILGSEVCDPMDRTALQERYKSIEEIYMATEGLLATSCSCGQLHLCEDLMHFELEPVHGSNLVSPIITDLHRRTQGMIRYRMNDLLELGDPCTCGSVCQTVKRVVGRSDDCFIFESNYSGKCLITPDRLRDCVLGSNPGISDFTLEQGSNGEVTLTMSKAKAEYLETALGALRELISGIGAQAPITGRLISQEQMSQRLTGSEKLRRIRRLM